MAPFSVRSLFASIALLVCGCLASSGAKGGAGTGQWQERVNEEGKKVQSMQIEAPSMTEEDQYGYTMPERYRCDSCRAVVHHLGEALVQRQPKSRRLQEWEYQDIFDETCKKSSFKGYGITVVGGENVLSGPGLKKDSKLQPGTGAIQMGGQTWENRLGEICRKLVYDRIGEDELYEHFRADGGLSQDKLCFQETRDCAVGPKAPPTGVAAQPQPTTMKAKKEKQAKRGNRKTDEALDANAFFAKLAAQQGIPKAEYTGKRGYAEWEKVLLSAAARISGREEVRAV
jgi:hypothetical protein